MKKLFSTLILFVYVLILQAQNKSTLTVEKIMQNPNWIGSSPKNILWSLDGQKIYFLWNPQQYKYDSIYEYDLSRNSILKSNFSEAKTIEAMNNGKWNSDFTQLVFEKNGDLFLYNSKTNSTQTITQTDDNEENPYFIQKNKGIVYEKKGNLFSWNMENGLTKQLTNFINSADPNSSKSITNQNQWLLSEQTLFTVLNERKKEKEDRNDILKSTKLIDTALKIYINDKIVENKVINNTGQYLFYNCNTPIKNNSNSIVPTYVTESGYTNNLNSRTKVGHTESSDELFIIDLKKNKNIAIRIDSLEGIYDIPTYLLENPTLTKSLEKKIRGINVIGAYWNETGNKLVIDLRALDNKDRWIVEYNLNDQKLYLINRQHDDAWIGGPSLYQINWVNDSTIIFKSESSGYAHLYQYQFFTKKTTQITSGNYEVQRTYLSKDKKYFYLITNETSPSNQQIYKMKVDGSNKQLLTPKEGLYEIYLSPNESKIAYRYSYVNQPWELFLLDNQTTNTKPQRITKEAISQTFSQYNWQIPKIVQIPSRDQKMIYAKIFEPLSSTKNNAAVVFVHGAGYLQNVHNGWSSYFREYMFHNLLTDKGYLVIDIDFRASSGYGRDWRTGIYRFMGGKDLDDNEDAIKYAIKKYGIDSSRIGMYGGSYGGFVTLMAMFTKPNLIQAGAAMRPVTDWAHYNHGYTSNILNTPSLDSMAYIRSSPIFHANGLKNHLLICHGLIDLNVHFQDVVRLNQKLIELGKDNWSLALYPLEDHGFVEPSSWIDEYKRILNLFDTYLLK